MMPFALYFLTNVVNILKYAILARVLMSWIQPGAHGPVSRFIYSVTEPVLAFFRSFIPPIGMMDLSPLAAFFAFDLLQYGIVQIGLTLH